MHDLDLLVPSALVDPQIAADLLRDQPMPHLARFVIQAGTTTTFDLPVDASLTTWQAWIFAVRAGLAVDRVNVAALWAMACGIAPATREGRYVMEPAHFHVANDHLRLDDPAALAYTLAEARELAASIEAVLAEAGWRLAPLEPATLRHWIAMRDDGAVLSAPSIERAIGDNVAAWQPRRSRAAADDVALAWRRCVNEIQMLWFGHGVNEAREANGQPTVNTLWLSGNGGLSTALPHYAAVDSSLPLLAALPIEPDAPRTLESFDGFTEPARREDWSGWREQLATFDARLGEILRRRAARSVGVVTLVLAGAEHAQVIVATPRDLAKAWRGWFRKAPSLAALFAEGALP